MMNHAVSSVPTTPNLAQGTASLVDMRNDGNTESQYFGHSITLTSRSAFTVECCGERTLGSNLSKGKHRLTIEGGAHVGEIAGKSPVYVSA